MIIDVHKTNLAALRVEDIPNSCAGLFIPMTTVLGIILWLNCQVQEVKYRRYSHHVVLLWLPSLPSSYIVQHAVRWQKI